MVPLFLFQFSFLHSDTLIEHTHLDKKNSNRIVVTSVWITEGSDIDGQIIKEPLYLHGYVCHTRNLKCLYICSMHVYRLVLCNVLQLLLSVDSFFLFLGRGVFHLSIKMCKIIRIQLCDISLYTEYKQSLVIKANLLVCTEYNCSYK